MPEEIENFFIRGAGGPSSSPKGPRQPIEITEGVSGQFIESGGSTTAVKRAVSLTQIRTVDLICEGEIEGLVTGDYTFVGNVGQIGYQSYTFKPYATKSIDGNSISYLRSIFWNETPVVDKDNLFNFQQINVSTSIGGPNGSSIEGIGDELTISRNVQERLRGPNSVLDRTNRQQIIGEVEQFAKYYRILNKDCLAANVNVRVNALSKTIIGGNKAGDTTATNIFYRIYYKPLFQTAGSINAENAGPEEQSGYIFAKEEEINGKISFGYIRSSRINFDPSLFNTPGFIGWAIKIFRLTPDSLQGALRNQTYVDSITEIYGSALNYPNSAIVSQKFNAEYFSQIPGRAFHARLLKVKIPSNYDPILKKYFGSWDGTWKMDSAGNESKFWTDNPAWCFYDLVTNSRYGLGKYIDPSLVDKWTLYEIAQYCDTLVPDGLGGVEPRFVCNMIINNREDAYRVINDMASVFRAIVYYFAGGIYSSMDIQKEPLYQFTNANVGDGSFTYSSSSKRVRHSVAIVRYNDKFNFYQPAVEYIEDSEAIKKYGYKELEVAAFGCTSRGQAIRYGRWALLSEGLETETISFEAGLEATYLRPGDIFKTFDRYRKNVRHGGRLYHIEGDSKRTFIVLDDFITGFQPNSIYNISIISPTYNYDPSQITNLSSEDIINIRKKQIQTISFSGGDTSNVSGLTSINVTIPQRPAVIDNANYSVTPNSVWTIEASGTSAVDANFTNQWEYYRVIKIEEKDSNRFSINGLEYDVTKYQAADSGLNFQAASITAPVPSAPDSISFAPTLQIVPGSTDLKGIRYTIIKASLTDVNGFLVYAKLGDWVASDFSQRFTDGSLPRVVSETPNESFLINILSNNNTTNYYIPLQNGKYYFRAYSRNNLGVPSVTAAEGTFDVNNLNVFQSLVISSLRLDGNSDNNLAQRTGDLYDTSSPTFRWQSSFENVLVPYSLGDISYRLSIRKSTSQDAINKAGPTETPVPGDPYQPSNVIYYQKYNYKPEEPSNPTFNFDIATNLSSVIQYYANAGSTFTGVIREYDVVVEAQLDNGDSSAGGNAIYGTRGGISDSSFLPGRSKGWDILYVNNPTVPSITLTQEGDLTSCLVNSTSNPNLVCSEQWLNPDGTVNLKIHTNNLPSDLAGGFIFTSKESFNSSEALNGRKTNGVEVYRSEFTDTSNPILARSNLLGFRSGFCAVAFYDTFDSDFKTEMLKVNPSFSDVFISGLNVSNIVGLKSRGIAENQGRFIAWADVQLDLVGQSLTKLGIDALRWIGAGVVDVRMTDDINYSTNDSNKVPLDIPILITFDTEIIKSTYNSFIYSSYFKTATITPVNTYYHGQSGVYLNEVNLNSSDQGFASAKIRVTVPTFQDPGSPVRIKLYKTNARFFIGIMTNEAEGLNIVSLSSNVLPP